MYYFGDILDLEIQRKFVFNTSTQSIKSYILVLIEINLYVLFLLTIAKTEKLNTTVEHKYIILSTLPNK